MKLYEFLNIPEQEQYQSVWEKGTHLENVTVGNEIYQLYAINDFFVEVIYDIASNSITGKNQFKYSPALDKYINRHV